MSEESADNRHALIIATSSYQDSGLGLLRSPDKDAADMGEVLGDQQIGQFSVTTVKDEEEGALRRSINRFLTARKSGEVVLVYLSCHGLRDPRGELFFAAEDTIRAQLTATAISWTWLEYELESCLAAQQILILDCCYSGAAGRPKSGEDLPGAALFGGRGRVVVTASRGTELAHEGEAPDDRVTGSVFTAAFVEGLRSGKADIRGDGFISVYDAYGYARDRMRSQNAKQNPQINVARGEGEILLARSSRRTDVSPAELPADVRDALTSSDPHVRIAAIDRIREWLESEDPRRRKAAQLAIQRLVKMPTDKSGSKELVVLANKSQEALALAAMDPAKAAEKLVMKPAAEAASLLAQMESRRAMTRLVAMRPSQAARVLEAMPTTAVTAVLSLHRMPPDRVVMILARMSPSLVPRLLRTIARDSPERHANLVAAMPKDKAAAMTGVPPKRDAPAKTARPPLSKPMAWRPTEAEPDVAERFMTRLVATIGGPINRYFGSEIHPRDLLHALLREVKDASRALGHNVSPNHGVIMVSPSWYPQHADLAILLARELAWSQAQFMVERGWTAKGPVTVDIYSDTNLTRGAYWVSVATVEELASELPTDPVGFPAVGVHPITYSGPAQNSTGARLVSADGWYLRVPYGPTVIGSEGADLVLPYAGVAPRHALLTFDGYHAHISAFSGAGILLVNGQSMVTAWLSPGDEIRLGTAVVRYLI